MAISRRQWLQTAAITSALLPPARPSPPAAGIELQPSALLVNGKPVFLIAGSFDYFRCPHELWRDTLLRARRAGLNTILFCIAWNFHEMREGVFDFSGDRDLGRFIDLCGELGLYAYPRFGPFICDEWEAGGHPAWLLIKPGVELRTLNAAALTYLKRWMDKVMPIIVARQATRSGPVILIQQENEYFFVGRPGVAGYQDFLIRSFREAGIDIPITDCNGANPQTRRPGSLLTSNGGGRSSVETLRRIQPDKPAIITELYTDFINFWGWPVSSYPTAQTLQQQTMETLGAGGMYAYFMMYGGTNFGFYASTSWKSDQSFVTTRYFSRAPIHEGGAFNESYFATKAVNLLAANFQDLFATAKTAPLPCGVSGPVIAQALQTARGFLLFLGPRYPSRQDSVYHTDGQSGALIQTYEEWPYAEMADAPGCIHIAGDCLLVAEPSSYPSMLPFQLEIDSECRVDYANATLLACAGTVLRRVLLFRGKAGAHGIASVNGQRCSWVFTAGSPVQLSIKHVTVIGIAHATADRTWFADGRVLIGPAFVGEKSENKHACFLDGDTTELVAISEEGVVTRHPLLPAAERTAHIPLKGWLARRIPELNGEAINWRDLDHPRTVEHLGAYQGYAWYRAGYRSPEVRQTSLLFTQASDRIHVFVNGRKAGICGRGPGAVRDPLPVELQAGDNQFLFLCDNMGRLSEGAVLDLKGIGGPAYLDAEVRPLPAPEWSDLSAAPTQSWPFQTFQHYYPKGKLRRATYQLAARPDEGLQLSLRWFPQYAWIALDGRTVAEHAGDLSLAGGVDFSSILLEPAAGHRRLEITIYGDAPVAWEKHVVLLAYRATSGLGRWAFHAWRNPEEPGTNPPGQPAWWEVEIAKPDVPGPLFLVTEGLSKGQAYLNGRALGRYWEIGPQHSLYLPDPWFAPHNRLAIFDEEGKSPERVYLIRDVRVATESVLA